MRLTIGLAVSCLLCLTTARAGEASVQQVGLGTFRQLTGAQEPVYGFDDLEQLQCVDARFGCTRLPGVAFRSESPTEDAYVVAVHDVTGPNSEPYALRAGPYFDVEGRNYVIRMDFDRPQTGVGFWVTTLRAADSCTDEEFVEIQATLANGEKFLTTKHPNFSVLRASFVGLVASGSPIVRVVVKSGLVSQECDDYEYFPKWGLDDLMFVPGPVPPPVCERTISTESDVRGSVQVEAAPTGGLEHVRLADDARNLVLELDPTFVAGAGGVDFAVRRGDPALDGTGAILATDAMGGTCRLDIDLRSPSERSESIAIFERDDQRLEIRGAARRSVTSTAVSASPALLDPSALPPGYSILETERARPTCDVLTVDGDFGEYDGVVYSVTDPVPKGTPRHRIRLLAAHSTDGGATFPPFEDVTESLDLGPTRRPATTRLTGRPGTSTFLLTCAYLIDIDAE